MITVIRRFTYQVTSDKPLLKQARWVGGYEPRVKARSERVYNTVQMGVTLENKIVIYFSLSKIATALGFGVDDLIQK